MISVLKGDRLKPVNTDVDSVGFLTTRQIEFFPARRAGTNKYGIKVFFQKSSHAIDPVPQPSIHAQFNNHGNFIVQHLCRQPESRNISPHQPARLIELFKHHDLITQRQQIVGYRQRCTTSTNTGNTLSVLLCGYSR